MQAQPDTFRPDYDIKVNIVKKNFYIHAPFSIHKIRIFPLQQKGVHHEQDSKQGKARLAPTSRPLYPLNRGYRGSDIHFLLVRR